MDSRQTKKTTTPFEYFLYAAIVTETALVAVVYKSIFGNADLARLSVYFALFYFAFLAWVIWQLNMLHHNRKAAIEAAPPEPNAAAETEADATRNTRSVLGLTAAQFIVVVLVFATAVATFSYALRVMH